MIHSRSIQSQKINLFASLLEFVIDGRQQYESLVLPVINDAYELSNGLKTYYTIDRNEFPVIVHLVKRDREYFKNLDMSNLKQDNYIHINSLLSGPVIAD